MKKILQTALEIFTDYGALKGLITWPKFSITSYKMLTELRRQDLTFGVIIDVGANVGQFAIAATKVFPNAQIYSFEPQSKCCAQLRTNVKNSPNIEVFDYALGSESKPLSLNINRYSHSSSFLETTEAHDNAFPNTKEVGIEEVRVERLDKIASSIQFQSPCLLKLDVQGFELAVIEGAKNVLDNIDYVILEASFKPLYEGEKLFLDLVLEMSRIGYRLLRPIGFLRDPLTAEILQADVLFARDSMGPECSDKLTRPDR
jgi:FkbM family methyltransferase